MAKKDFPSNVGDVQGVGPNTRAPRTSGTPKTGFDDAGSNKVADNGPGPGVQPNRKKIR